MSRKSLWHLGIVVIVCLGVFLRLYIVEPHILPPIPDLETAIKIAEIGSTSVYKQQTNKE